MIHGFIAVLPNAILALLVLALAHAVAKRAGFFVSRISASRWPRGTLGIILGRLLRWAIVLFGLLVALSITFPSLAARDIIQFLGIGTVAIGFAFRDVLQNFLAGIILLITHPFRIGDEISLENVDGIVQEIETRATMIKTYDGSIVAVPNAAILTRNVVVNTAFQTRRGAFEIDLDQEVDIEVAKQTILEAVSGVDGILKHPSPRVRVKDFSSGNWRVRVTWWTPCSRQEWLGAKDRVIPAIKQSLNRAGIELPSDPLDSLTEQIAGRSGLGEFAATRSPAISR